MYDEIKFDPMSGRSGEPTEKEKDMVRFLTGYKYSGRFDNVFALLVSDKDCYMIWNLLADGMSIFRFQETGDGYLITYSDPRINEEGVIF